MVVRFLLGVPLGSDISNGYTYLMESMPKSKCEVMGNRWQFMFAVGEVMTLAVIAVFLVANLDHKLVWRVTLGLGAVLALVIMLMRHNLPETAVWLIRRGRFRKVKQISRDMYNDDLAMLPDDDVVIPKAQPTAFLADMRRDPIRWRATLYGWISCFCQASEFSTFAFYLPVLLLTVGVTADDLVGTNLALIGLYTFAAISGWVGSLLTPRIGQRGISIAGFGTVFMPLLVAAWAIYTGNRIVSPSPLRRCCGATTGTPPAA